MLVKQEYNAEGEDQSLDDGLSLASSHSSMSNMSVGGDSLKLTPQLPSPKQISQPKVKLPDIGRDETLLDDNNNEEDGIVSDENYILSRKEQLKKQLKDEEVRAKSMRNSLMHPSQCEEDIDGDGGSMGFGIQSFGDDDFGNDTTGETDSSSNDDHNTDWDSDARPNHSITTAEVSHSIVDELDQAEQVHPPIVDVLDKTEESHPPIVDVMDKSAQQPHSTETTTSRGLIFAKLMNQSVRTMRRQYSSNITTENEYTYQEEPVAFW